MCFKAFDYQVTMTESKSSLWNFLTSSPHTQKKYAVFCTPDISKAKGLIKVALKKVPQEHRLVVVTSKVNDEEQLQMAEDNDFCLVSLNILNDFGQQMLEIKNLGLTSQTQGETLLDKPQSQRDESNEVEGDSPSDFIDKVISKERLF